MITIEYRCQGSCGRRAKIEMRDRKPREDIVSRTKEATRRASNDHDVYSPTCRSKTCDLMFPLSALP